MPQPGWEDTTFKHKGTSGGFVADKHEAAGRKLKYPPSQPSEPFNSSTKHFVDDEETQVQSKGI